MGFFHSPIKRVLAEVRQTTRPDQCACSMAPLKYMIDNRKKTKA